MPNILKFIFLYFSVTAFSVAADLSLSPEAFGTLPEIYSVKISPDGDRILSLETRNGKMILITREVNNLEGDEHLIPLEKGEYNWAQWVSNDRIIASYRYNGHEDRGRNLTLKVQRRLLSMKWDGSDIFNPLKFKLRERLSSTFIARQPQFQDSVIDILKNDPEHILLQLDINKLKVPAVYKVNVITKKRTRVIQGRNLIDFWMTDQDHIIRYAEGVTPSRNKTRVRHFSQYRKAKGSSWITLFDFNKLNEKRPFYFEGFTDDPTIIYILMDGENGKRGLYTYNVDQKEMVEKIAGDDAYDIVDVNFDDNNKLEYFLYYRDRPQYVRFDKDGQELDKIFKTTFPNSTVSIESKSKDKNQITFKVTSPAEPGAYYFLDLNSGEMKKIGQNFQKLDLAKLSNMTPIKYQARDGLVIPGYLSLPKDQLSEKLPTIILPHGGPMDRDGWGFDYWVQFLNSRGYAVLQMNYRGSTGYGEDYMNKGYHEWGRYILNDINDGAKWMIDQGYADPERMCIMGGSYGGYAALQAPVMDNFLYKCAIAFAPITDLSSFLFLMKDNGEFKFFTNYIKSDNWTLDEASPIDNIDKINIPILLMHGEKDMNSPVGQSRSFYKKMQKKDKNIKYFEFEGENHFLSKQKYRIKFLQEIEKFLAKHLKERN